MDANVPEMASDSDRTHLENSLENTWSGHLPMTQRQLLSIVERATPSVSNITVPERALFMACEFWAAVKGRELYAHWRSSAEANLRTLMTIFEAIGLFELADALAAMERESHGPLTRAQRRRRVTALEAKLRSLNVPVDEALCQFAQSIAQVPIICKRFRRE